MTPEQQIDTIHQNIEALRELTVASIMRAMEASKPNTPAYAVWGVVSTIIGTYYMLSPEQQKEFLRPKTELQKAILNLADAEALAEIEMKKLAQGGNSSN